MTLSQRYDDFYRDIDEARFGPVPYSKKFPRGRVDAILADAVPSGTVLDIGCGDGSLLYLLRDRYSNFIGLEYSGERLKRARQNLADLPFRGVIGSAENMREIDDDSIDCIVSADTVEHIPDVYEAVGEMFRVLKPGGYVVINTPNIAYIKRRVQLLFGRFPSTSQSNEGFGSTILFDGGHLHYFTYRSLRLLLERYGFKVIKRRAYSGIFRYVCQVKPSLMSVGVQWVAQKPALTGVEPQ